MAVLDLINDQFANDIAMQARASNQAFVSTMAGTMLSTVAALKSWTKE